MNELPHDLEVQLRAATQRSSLGPAAPPELREWQAAFLQLGRQLERAAGAVDSATLAQTVLQPRIKAQEKNEQLSWSGMLSLAAGLLVVAGLAALMSGEQSGKSSPLVLSRFQSSVPRNELVSNSSTPAWEDDWDSRYEAAEDSLSSVDLNRLSYTDAAALDLRALLDEVQSEIAAESM